MRDARVRLSASLSSFHPEHSSQSRANTSATGAGASTRALTSGLAATSETPSTLNTLITTCSPGVGSIPPFQAHTSRQSMSSVVPGTSPNDIQSHLYQSFLEGRTADVVLHVRGTWEGLYRLHRVVLIQAGFFRSLFDGGFRESSHKETVDINFDDTNITRAAFEVCISRLYGGGPVLHVDPRLVPSRNIPLTDSFPNPKPEIPAPSGHHPATPRFLLSLLATAIYLSIPALASQALQLILSSVGPRTVLPYLNFAIGKGIPKRLDDELEAAVGLEHICDKVSSPSTPSAAKKSASKHVECDDNALVPALENLQICQKERSSEVTSTGKDSNHSDDDTDDEDDDCGTCFSYGPVSDKIGEAAACWLTRWGTDMLPHEESIVEEAHERRSQSQPSRRANDIPVIWRRAGLTAKWTRVVISSDAFFAPSERERYNFACRVVEMRRKEGVDTEEEEEWNELFSHGIYYMHMSLDDLIDVSRHLSPTTNAPFTPMSVIQSAHWNQALLRQAVSARPRSSSGSPPRSPPPLKDELGISVSTAELLASLEPSTPECRLEDEKRYYPVPVDSSLRIGDWDTSGTESQTMEQLFTARTQMTRTGSGRRLQTLARTSESNFFGILNERRTAAECIVSDAAGTARWSPFPPFRFGVEFWGVEHSTARLYSQTVWYAGNLFNVYAQVVKKKGVQQLGVYLHRQSSVDPIPPPSAPPMNATERAKAQGPGHGRNSSVPTTSVSQMSIPASASMHSLIPRPGSRGTTTTVNAGPSRSTTPTSTSSQSALHRSTQTVILAPAQPYRDPRSSINAYFTIYCASPTGSSLTRFSSAPDVFSVSQSWGWKSSSLHLQPEDTASGGSSGSPTLTSSLAKEVSVRATGVLGIV